jgi:hypothetical protein
MNFRYRPLENLWRSVVSLLLAAGTAAISDPEAWKTILVSAVPAVLVVVKGLLARRVGDPNWARQPRRLSEGRRVMGQWTQRRRLYSTCHDEAVCVISGRAWLCPCRRGSIRKGS